jgi:hypothetical protein
MGDIFGRASQHVVYEILHPDFETRALDCFDTLQGGV